VKGKGGWVIADEVIMKDICSASGQSWDSMLDAMKRYLRALFLSMCIDDSHYLAFIAQMYLFLHR
jgi:hypothetical protein